MIRATPLLLLLLLAACGVPAAVWTAGLGFGAAALTFDDELLKAVEGGGRRGASGAAGTGDRP